MGLIFFSVVISFLVSFISIPLLIKISYANNLFDLPSLRKSHSYPVSFLGGIGIFMAVVLSMTITLPSSDSDWLQYLLASSVLIFLLGLYDDILFLSPLKKFIGQLIAITIIIEQGQFQITSLYGFLGIFDMNSVSSYIFTYLTILLIINAYNLIDGVDGLAGTLALIATVFFGIVFLLDNDLVFAAMSFSIAAALAAFLIFNYTPPKIFLGDTGSLLIGLFNAVLVIRFINLETSPGSFFHSSSAAAIGLSVLFIPIIDTFRVMILRIYRRKSPFVGDQNHIHHMLLKRGYSHIKVTLILTFINAFLIFYTVLFKSFGITFLLFSTPVVFFSVLKLFLINSDINGFDKDRKDDSAVNQQLSDKLITPTGKIEATQKNS
jgi:UDP-N-acetylmuramyl pentapeptide phosphotransferase/UDP-N-acetylglucosamine-1-phosphate transferase